MPVPEGLAGMRVDAGLARLLGLSRTAAAALAEDGGVDLDGARAGKSDKLTAGAWLEVRLPEAPAPVENTPVEIEGMEILYSDDDIVAVDKPPGVAAHATVGWHGPTVLGGLAAAGFRISTSGIHERQGIVHRLDVGTSGVMVVALSERAYTVLKRAFKQRTVEKRYHALVQGHPDPSSGTIDAPIGRHRGHDWKFAVTEGGRHSVTHYDTLEAHQAASLLDIELETGRTHQIRVHFAALHHPCAGDLTYGADPTLAKKLGLERQWLHARSLAFAHPADGRRVEITSPYPADLQHALDVLRGTTHWERPGKTRRSGLLFGVGAYASWGLFPAFFPLLKPASAFEILAHRIVWCFVLMVVVIAAVRRLGDIRAITPRTWLLLTFASALISVNWVIYIYAVNNGHVVDAALGYFINPLVTVALGLLVFRERLNRAQFAALAIAVVAVVVLTVEVGSPPIIGLGLALSFGLYGAVKKVVPTDPRVSVGVEAGVAGSFALAYIVVLQATGDATFTSHGPGHVALMVLSGVLTALPLLLFAAAAQRLPLVTMGLLFYLTPAMQLTWGVVVGHEPMPPARWLGFGLIWVALAVFSVDALWRARVDRGALESSYR